MNCDICGRMIVGQAFKVKVEGAKMLVCNHCQALGKPYAEESPPRPPVTIAPRIIPSTTRIAPRYIPRRTPEIPKGLDDVDIADDYGTKVRRHRMKLGLSQEDLASRVKVKVSVIQKIETGKMTPDLRLCRDLEHELKIKLVTPHEAEDAKVPKTEVPEGVTLGDIIHVKGNTKPDLTD
ncbi:MAG: multiprotein bridging factor aMBF1 [Candidatus Bathyarchaeia archaeon]